MVRTLFVVLNSVAARRTLPVLNLVAKFRWPIFLLAAAGIAFHYRGTYRIDLDVYRIGATVWAQGGNLYGPMPATQAGVGLPFTYPPISAVLLWPLTLVSLHWASAILTVITAVLLALTLEVVATALGLNRFVQVLGFLVALIVVDPIVSTITYGQVNVILMTLVVLDCLLPKTRWPRGLLVGLAAAIKLTPAVFLLYFLLRKDYRALITTVLSFALFGAIGFLASWGNSVQYWTSTIFDSARIGGVAYAQNQSLQGIIARLGFTHGQASILWIGSSLLVVVLAVVGMWRALADNKLVWAVTLNALAGLLISPVSWSHHWVWAAVALLALVATGLHHKTWLPTIMAVIGLVVFIIHAQSWLPAENDRELLWTPWQHLIGNTYSMFAVAVLIIAATSTALWRPKRQVITDQELAELRHDPVDRVG